MAWIRKLNGPSSVEGGRRKEGGRAGLATVREGKKSGRSKGGVQGWSGMKELTISMAEDGCWAKMSSKVWLGCELWGGGVSPQKTEARTPRNTHGKLLFPAQHAAPLSLSSLPLLTQNKKMNKQQQ